MPTLNLQGRFGAVSRRGICHIWFRGRQLEARSVAESSEGSSASKSDRTGRNKGRSQEKGEG